MTERSGVICAGNWIVDIVHDITRWPRESDLVRINSQSVSIGGGAANVMAALRKLKPDLPLDPIGVIGRDQYGQLITEHCQQLGVETTAMRVDDTAATAHTHVMSVPGHTRTFFYQGGANDALGEGDIPDALLGRMSARIFYLGYLMLLGSLDRLDGPGPTGAAQVLARASARGMITCVDLVSVAHRDYAASVGRALPHIDFLLLNDIEAVYATGAPPPLENQVPANDQLADMADQLVKGGVRRAVILHTPRTSLWFPTGGQPIWADSAPLADDEIVSPLGAGDAFCAGLLLAIHENRSAQRCLALANATARASLRGLTASEAMPDMEDLDRALAGPDGDSNCTPTPGIDRRSPSVPA